MRVLGATFKGPETCFVLFEEDADGDLRVIAEEPKKLALSDPDDTEGLRSFSRTISALVRENHIDRIAIRGCTTKGQYKSGASAFKMEAALQLQVGVDVDLHSAQTVSAFAKKGPKPLATLHSYQEGAFHAAVLSLSQARK
jgi:hypothetical protein